MRIAILLADTDDTILPRNHPDDGAKFAALMSLHRPEWNYETVPIRDGVFPASGRCL